MEKLISAFFHCLLYGFATVNTVSKGALYYNEVNGAPKRINSHNNRFSEGDSWWEILIYAGILFFTACFLLSNFRRMSVELRRVVTTPDLQDSESLLLPNREEEPEDALSSRRISFGNRMKNFMKYFMNNVAPRATTLFKTGVAAQSFFRLVLHGTQAAGASTTISCIIAGAPTAVCLWAAYYCNGAFYSPRSPEPSTGTNSEGCLSMAAKSHGCTLPFSLMTAALYYNSANYFPTHVDESNSTLSAALLNNSNPGRIAGFIFLILGDAFIALSTQRGYAFRLLKCWEDIPNPPPEFVPLDLIDVAGAGAKAAISCMSVFALLTASSSGRSNTLPLLTAVLAGPGNAACEVVTFLRHSPRCLLWVGEQLKLSTGRNDVETDRPETITTHSASTL